VGANLLENNVQEAAKATISFDKNFEAYGAVEGVAGVLLAPDNTDQYVYCSIKGFSCGDNIKTVTNAALAQANFGHEQVNLLEVSALAGQQQATRERNGLIEAYTTELQLHTAIGCARSVTGEGGAFSQVAGLLKCVMSLHQRYIPAINDWYKCEEEDLTSWQSSPFYFPVEARPWFPNSDGKAHVAAYSCMSDISYCHLILQERGLQENQLDHNDVRNNGFMACSDLRLVVLKGNSEDELLAKMRKIEQQLDAPLNEIALNCYQDFISGPKADYCLSLIAESTKALHKEIQLAKTGLMVTFADPSVEWETPKGSFFSAKPIKDEGNDTVNKNNVAFLYPGIGATYLGLGRDLFHLFPQIVPPVIALADDIGETLKDTQLYPRSVQRLNVKALGKLDLKLRGELANIAECGVGFACIFTKVFEQVFDVKADFATGYSMGEVSMYAALGCWQQPGLLSARLAQSDTFNHQLCGELRTLRTHWGLPDVADGQFEKIWETYTVKTTMDKVSIALEGEDRVFCTIVNTPDSLLFGGYPADCERVIEKMGVWSMPLNMANAIHSAPAQLEYDKIVELHTMDVTDRINTKMYSSSCYLPIPQRSKAIAHSVAKCLCDPVDFPRLINTLHDKGARVFVEMGPGLSLCRWVGRILNVDAEAPKAHLAVPVNAKGTPDELTYLRAVAKLASHGVELNLNSLFHGSIIVAAT
ncbi:MAG: PfaB family protein, partial [Algicola sp.]|nr:PfaB family protein [Algicola sp.]